MLRAEKQKEAMFSRQRKTDILFLLSYSASCSPSISTRPFPYINIRYVMYCCIEKKTHLIVDLNGEEERNMEWNVIHKLRVTEIAFSDRNSFGKVLILLSSALGVFYPRNWSLTKIRQTRTCCESATGRATRKLRVKHAAGLVKSWELQEHVFRACFIWGINAPTALPRFERDEITRNIHFRVVLSILLRANAMQPFTNLNWQNGC